jgi:hypothetical protein
MDKEGRTQLEEVLRRGLSGKGTGRQLQSTPQARKTGGKSTKKNVQR